MYPEDLRYTPEHEWVRSTDDGSVLIGITHFAQDSLGDIVYVDLPDVGAVVEAGGPCGEVESTKSVSEIYAPVAGEVLERNDALEAAPESVNADPYGAGWLVRLRPSDPADVAGLLGATEYQELLGRS